MSDDIQVNITAVGPGVLLGGRYRLTARIGRGGMADVYRGEDQLLHRSVAVKVFRFEAGAGDRRRVDAEVRLLASLRHPGLVTVFDAGNTDRADTDHQAGDTPTREESAYLVMDLIDGPTLAERLNQGPLSASQTAQLGAELAKTLAYVHSQGVVHRDVKPANILLDHQPHPSDPGPAWSAKLSDFGISRLLDGTRLTIHGTTVGTANYMSPEQAETGHTSTASDVYSLGLVLIESLTGQVVYPGSGIPAALARLHRPPVVPTEFGPDWTTLLTGMTERHPDARPSAAEVSDTLRQLQTAARDPRPPTDPTPTQPTTVLTVTGEGPAQTAVMPASPAPVATGPHRARSRRHRQLVGAAAVVGLLVVILALTLPGSSGIAPPLPAPSYPSVTGPLGSPIRHLEGTIP